jgi:hypothetical protein
MQIQQTIIKQLALQARRELSAMLTSHVFAVAVPGLFGEEPRLVEISKELVMIDSYLAEENNIGAMNNLIMMSKKYDDFYCKKTKPRLQLALLFIGLTLVASAKLDNFNKPMQDGLLESGLAAFFIGIILRGILQNNEEKSREADITNIMRSILMEYKKTNNASCTHRFYSERIRHTEAQVLPVAFEP